MRRRTFVKVIGHIRLEWVVDFVGDQLTVDHRCKHDTREIIVIRG